MSLASWGQTLPADAIVIGNQTGFESISEKQLRLFMRGELQRWKGGSDLSVTVVLPSTKLPEAVPTSEFLVNSARPASLQKYWLGLVFEGRAKAPIFGQTQDEILRAVMDRPGSIAIVYGIDVPNSYVIRVTKQ